MEPKLSSLSNTTPPESGAGWNSDLPTFEAAEPSTVCMRLADFVADADESQKSAWKTWVPQLQKQVDKLLAAHPPAADYTAILEYRLPRDFRRPDLIVLEGGVVVLLELKGMQVSERAGLDQVLAYARDLKAYHEECHERPVVPILVRPAAPEPPRSIDGAWVVSPSGISGLLLELAHTLSAHRLTPEKFLRDDAYCPLPSIVDAARDLFEHGELPFIKRARACTDPALEAISQITREAAATRTRHFVVLQGVPGSGKTLVGLQLVHARWLDDLASGKRPSGTRQVPAVYLTGNGPLQEVMQDALASAGGGGQTFVQSLKKYVSHYAKTLKAPPEHVVVFDEAQRAHDAQQVAHVHDSVISQSEPDLLLEFMARVPDWCVVVALVGTGQAIHSGEEVGLPLWREALLKMRTTGPRNSFTVHAPAEVEQLLSHPDLDFRWVPSLNLNTELRHHFVSRVDTFVECILDNLFVQDPKTLAEELWTAGHRFILTRNLSDAKAYLRDRYWESPKARYGLIASSRCKRLTEFGVDNTFSTLRRFRAGKWFNSPPADHASCCQLEMVGTEFKVQGLELDMVIHAWGSDFIRQRGRWSDSLAARHRNKVKDSLLLRQNSYRVLLTRGRDGTLIFVPPDALFDETWDWLVGLGIHVLSPKA
jgi:hypothetical protein